MSFKIGQAVRTNWGPGNIVRFYTYNDIPCVVVSVWGAGEHVMRIEQIGDYPVTQP